MLRNRSSKQFYLENANIATALTIGNFDGLHLGHKFLVDRINKISALNSVSSVLLSFDPHPSVYFNVTAAHSKPLFTLSQKIRACKELRLDSIVIEPFTGIVANMSYQQFFRSIMFKNLKAKYIVVGNNFCFGKDRLGTSEALAKICKKHNIKLEVPHLLNANDATISSTSVKKHLSTVNEFSLANKMLGHNYVLEGIIKPGDQIGRTINFPTANLHNCKQFLPHDGVYYGYAVFRSSSEKNASLLSIDCRARKSVFNIGFRPSIKTNKLEHRIEAHLVNKTNQDLDCLYQKEATFYLTGHIRDELKFNSLEELKVQIQKDINFAETKFGD